VSGKRILILIVIVMLGVLLCILPTNILPSDSAASTVPEMILYINSLNVGIAAAVLCIALFFMYIFIRFRRKH